MLRIVTDSFKETFAFAQNFAATLKAGDVVALLGEIGAGKTAFVKGIAAYFGVDAISSPTFTLMCEYIPQLSDLAGIKRLYHFDAYRIKADDWLSLGFDEYVYGNGVCLIEWADIVREHLPDSAVSVCISRVEGNEESREINISNQCEQIS